jgi:perosamine synthetase
VGAFIPLTKVELTKKSIRFANDAMRSGWVTHRGNYYKKFENKFSMEVGMPSLFVSSGTAALHLALLACGVGPGDEVIVPDLTFGATATAVIHTGATPVMVDVEDYRISINGILNAITPNTKAIIPVHLYGLECDMDSIIKIAMEYNLWVIEDSCEALGMVKPRGHFACFSFFANKLITTGEGGMVCTNDGEFYNRARAFRDGGFNSEYEYTIPGLNYRATNMQAAIGLGEIGTIEEKLSHRERVVSKYKEHLEGDGKWLFVVRTKDPRDLSKKLRKAGVESRPVFKPLHLQGLFNTEGRFPNSIELWQHGLCLPTGDHVTDQDIERICSIIKEE